MERRLGWLRLTNEMLNSKHVPHEFLAAYFASLVRWCVLHWDATCFTVKSFVTMLPKKTASKTSNWCQTDCKALLEQGTPEHFGQYGEIVCELCRSDKFPITRGVWQGYFGICYAEMEACHWTGWHRFDRWGTQFTWFALCGWHSDFWPRIGTIDCEGMRQPPHTLATDGVLKLAILQKSVVGLRVDRCRVIATWKCFYMLLCECEVDWNANSYESLHLWNGLNQTFVATTHTMVLHHLQKLELCRHCRSACMGSTPGDGYDTGVKTSAVL